MAGDSVSRTMISNKLAAAGIQTVGDLINRICQERLIFVPENSQIANIFFFRPGTPPFKYERILDGIKSWFYVLAVLDHQMNFPWKEFLINRPMYDKWYTSSSNA